MRLLILAIGLFTNCYLLGNGPLAGTEGHRALTSHQMVTSGQWLIPHLYDQVYLRKPPLQYWIMGGVEKVTGLANTFIWRLPSAVFGALTGVVLCLMTGRWYGRLAGLVAGVSSCGLIALWGQNRTAEIDALNTLVCVSCACAILDMGWGPARGRMWMAGLAAITFAAALLDKGPAGFAPIAGALLGPAMMNRTGRALKSPLPWIAMAVGTLPLIVYAMAAYSAFTAQHANPDYHGATEVFRNFLADRRKNIPETLELIPNLILYTQPISAFMLFPFHPTMWRVGSAWGEWSESDRLLLRGLVGTLIVSALGDTFLGAGASAVQLCLVADDLPDCRRGGGGVGRGVLPGNIRMKRVPEFAAGAVIFYGIGVIVIAVLAVKSHAPMTGRAIAAGAVAAVVAAGVVIAAARQRNILAGWGFIGLVLLAGVAFGSWGIADRDRRSTTEGSEYLKHNYPPGTTFTTGDLIFQQPELFFYSGMKAESYPYNFVQAFELPTSRWLIMKPSEYESWNAEIPDRLKDGHVINKFPEVVMVWFVAKGDAAGASTRR